MKKLAIVLTLTAACEAGIGPDPTSSSNNNTNNTTSSSNGGSTSSAGGGGNDGGGGSGGSNNAGGGTPGGGYESGTRLKERYLTGQDGTRHHLGWFDTEKGVECSWRSSGGTMRCLPNGKLLNGYFSDSACQQRILLSAITCSIPNDYAIGFDTCGLDARVYTIGAETNPALVYVQSGASCVNVAKPSDFIFNVVGAEVPGSEFVSASISTEQ